MSEEDDFIFLDDLSGEEDKDWHILRRSSSSGSEGYGEEQEDFPPTPIHSLDVTKSSTPASSSTSFAPFFTTGTREGSGSDVEAEYEFADDTFNPHLHLSTAVTAAPSSAPLSATNPSSIAPHESLCFSTGPEEWLLLRGSSSDEDVLPVDMWSLRSSNPPFSSSPSSLPFPQGESEDDYEESTLFGSQSSGLTLDSDPAIMERRTTQTTQKRTRSPVEHTVSVGVSTNDVEAGLRLSNDMVRPVESQRSNSDSSSSSSSSQSDSQLTTGGSNRSVVVSGRAARNRRAIMRFMLKQKLQREAMLSALYSVRPSSFIATALKKKNRFYLANNRTQHPSSTETEREGGVEGGEGSASNGNANPPLEDQQCRKSRKQRRREKKQKKMMQNQHSPALPYAASNSNLAQSAPGSASAILFVSFLTPNQKKQATKCQGGKHCQPLQGQSIYLSGKAANFQKAHRSRYIPAPRTSHNFHN